MQEDFYARLRRMERAFHDAIWSVAKHGVVTTAAPLRYKLVEAVAPPDGSPYPTRGQVFPIRLVRGSFAEQSEASLATQPGSAAATRWCYQLRGEIPPEGELLAAFEIGGLWYTRHNCCARGCAESCGAARTLALSYSADEWETAGNWLYRSGVGLVCHGGSGRLVPHMPLDQIAASQWATVRWSIAGDPGSAVLRLTTHGGRLAVRYDFAEPGYLEIWIDGARVSLTSPIGYSDQRRTDGTLQLAVGEQEGWPLFPIASSADNLLAERVGRYAAPDRLEHRDWAIAAAAFAAAHATLLPEVWWPAPGDLPDDADVALEIDGLPVGSELIVSYFGRGTTAPATRCLAIDEPPDLFGFHDFARRDYTWAGANPYPVTDVAYGPGFPHRAAETAALYTESEHWRIERRARVGEAYPVAAFAPQIAGAPLRPNLDNLPYASPAARAWRTEQLRGSALEVHLLHWPANDEREVLRLAANYLDAENYLWCDLWPSALEAGELVVQLRLGVTAAGEERFLALGSYRIDPLYRSVVRLIQWPDGRCGVTVRAASWEPVAGVPQLTFGADLRAELVGKHKLAVTHQVGLWARALPGNPQIRVAELHVQPSTTWCTLLPANPLLSGLTLRPQGTWYPQRIQQFAGDWDGLAAGRNSQVSYRLEGDEQPGSDFAAELSFSNLVPPGELASAGDELFLRVEDDRGASVELQLIQGGLLPTFQFARLLVDGAEQRLETISLSAGRVAIYTQRGTLWARVDFGGGATAYYPFSGSAPRTPRVVTCGVRARHSDHRVTLDVRVERIDSYAEHFRRRLYHSAYADRPQLPPVRLTCPVQAIPGRDAAGETAALNGTLAAAWRRDLDLHGDAVEPTWTNRGTTSSGVLLQLFLERLSLDVTFPRDDADSDGADRDVEFLLRSPLTRRVVGRFHAYGLRLFAGTGLNPNFADRGTLLGQCELGVYYRPLSLAEEPAPGFWVDLDGAAATALGYWSDDWAAEAHFGGRIVFAVDTPVNADAVITAGSVLVIAEA